MQHKSHFNHQLIQVNREIQIQEAFRRHYNPSHNYQPERRFNLHCNCS